jgi:hypothetical protein
VTATVLRDALHFAERRLFHRRERRDPLAEARARLHGYTSPVASLSVEEKGRLFAYDGPEVSGKIRHRRRA